MITVENRPLKTAGRGTTAKREGLRADYSGCRACNTREVDRFSSSLPQFNFSERPSRHFLGGPQGSLLQMADEDR